MKKNVLVTGGGGFLGRYICQALTDQGYEVFSLARGHYPFLAEMGVTQIKGDITNLADVEKAAKGCFAIIHSAAKAGIWGRRKDFYEINVVGTQNIVAAAKKAGVRRLVYTSSPSIVFSGADIKGAGEELAYAESYICDYPWSKKIAEEHVLKSHDPNILATVALRPHLIWGPNDPHFVPRLRERAQRKRLFQVGNGDNWVDVIYVENAAFAHVQAMEQLDSNERIGGQAYFLGQDDPVRLWSFVKDILKACGEETKIPKIPFAIAYAVGFISEMVYKALGLFDREPKITRFVALQLAKSHFFSHAKAKRDFGYRQLVSTSTGLEKLHDSLK